ncbi:hypothetical protein [Methylobacterium oryzisoli]|uniref:hypothetical protein n=1 Tax=Methylobacterium oryzisoli TaxID=3385502 RepID=UPI0038918632
MFQDINPYGFVTYVDRVTGEVDGCKVLDMALVRKEERRLRKVIAGMIRSVPREERPKPSLVWTNTLIDNLGAELGKPVQLEDGNPGTLTFAMVFTGQMLLHASAMGLLKYLGYRNVLITNASIGYAYVKLPGTTEEVIERLERDGALKLYEHARALGSAIEFSVTKQMVERLRASRQASL